jgi:hypothetical protein
MNIISDRASIGASATQPCDTQYDMLLDLNRDFQKENGFEILTPDAKLFCVVGAKGTLSVKEAMLYSGLSYRGFYLVAARLVNRGVIVFDADPRDARVRRISLGRRTVSLDRWFLSAAGMLPATAGGRAGWMTGAAA